MSQLFGFIQLDLAGVLPLGDGRYLIERDGEQEKAVLVVQTLSAPPTPPRRRRRRLAEGHEPPPELPLSRATAILAGRPFTAEAAAERWLDASLASEQEVETLLDEGVLILNAALVAHALAAEDPDVQERAVADAVVARIGFGGGEDVADGRSARVTAVGPGRALGSRRRRREAELRPQERLAALLAGRERAAAFELPLLRARADLDAGRLREAALQLDAALDALLSTIDPGEGDEGHARDIEALAERRERAGAAARAAARADLPPDLADELRELLETAERVMRRRRVLRGG